MFPNRLSRQSGTRDSVAFKIIRLGWRELRRSQVYLLVKTNMGKISLTDKMVRTLLDVFWSRVSGLRNQAPRVFINHL